MNRANLRALYEYVEDWGLFGKRPENVPEGATFEEAEPRLRTKEAHGSLTRTGFRIWNRMIGNMSRTHDRIYGHGKRQDVDGQKLLICGNRGCGDLFDQMARMIIHSFARNYIRAAAYKRGRLKASARRMG